jgi:hypothetical protein
MARHHATHVAIRLFQWACVAIAYGLGPKQRRMP